MDAVTFPSKIDWWLGAVLLLCAGASAVAAVSVAAAEPPLVALAMSPLLLLLGCVLPVWLLLATRYTFGATDLEVRSGPFVWRIPLREIHAVTATRNPLSSPALSLDRLRIDFGRSRSIMVSPADKEGFLSELRGRAPVAGASGGSSR